MLCIGLFDCLYFGGGFCRFGKGVPVCEKDNCADCDCYFGWSFHILNLLVIAIVMVYMISTTSAIEPMDVSSSCHQVCL